MSERSEPVKKLGSMAKRPSQERGVLRYNALLDAAHALLIEHELDDLGLYLIAEKACVPPASAYHFFPTPVAVFLALAERYHRIFSELVINLEMPDDDRWQTLLRQCLAASARMYNENPPMQKLFLGSHTVRELALSEAGFNELMAQRVMESCDRHFHMPTIRDSQRKYLVVLTLVDAIWSLSYTKYRTITREYEDEAGLVAVSYCRTFLPEVIESRDR